MISTPQTESADSAGPILIVDDDQMVLQALSETLRSDGFTIVTCARPLEALGLVEKQAFPVVLIDQMMPEMTGLELMGRIKEIQPDASRILITGVPRLATVIEAINQGEIYRYIAKPWMRADLLATIRSAVQRYHLLRQNAAFQKKTFAMNEELTRLNAALEAQVAKVDRQNRELSLLNEALSQNLQRSVELCLRTMETFYPVLGVQGRRAHELCGAMADVLSLSADERQVLGISALLHDIGLIGVSRPLIRRWQERPASLSPAEKRLVQQHPILGEELTGFAQHLRLVGPAIRGHHERFDGDGYPDGLRGDDIPWLARLLAVAVSYIERDGDPSKVVEAITEETGKAFDPEAVRAFLRCVATAPVSRKKREVLLRELQPGMVLASGIHTTTGLLLIPEGQRLTENMIERLANHDRLGSLGASVVVYARS